MTQELSLTEKHRPKTLSAIVGQSFAVMSLTDFLDFPFPQAFLFSGASGVGKTSAGIALANDLGINQDFNFIYIESGKHDQEAVESALSCVRRVGIKDGWKMILCDEADMMSPKCKAIWLSSLEGLQRGEFGKTVVVFTTNDISRFETRFRDRCEHIEFESDPRTLHVDAEGLLADLWWQEGLPGTPPALESIRGLVEDGAISFRRLVQFVQKQTRLPRTSADLAAARQAKIEAAKSVGVRPVSSVML